MHDRVSDLFLLNSPNPILQIESPCVEDASAKRAVFLRDVSSAKFSRGLLRSFRHTYSCHPPQLDSAQISSTISTRCFSCK